MIAIAAALTLSFDADAIGQPPAGWTCGATGRGASVWSVEAEKYAPDKG